MPSRSERASRTSWMRPPSVNHAQPGQSQLGDQRPEIEHGDVDLHRAQRPAAFPVRDPRQALAPRVHPEHLVALRGEEQHEQCDDRDLAVMHVTRNAVAHSLQIADGDQDHDDRGLGPSAEREQHACRNQDGHDRHVQPGDHVIDPQQVEVPDRQRVVELRRPWDPAPAAAGTARRGRQSGQSRSKALPHRAPRLETSRRRNARKMTGVRPGV